VATGPIKGHIRTSSWFAIVKARKLTISDDTSPQTQDTPVEELVGGFGDEEDVSQAYSDFII
jgi:hypothetical protein